MAEALFMSGRDRQRAIDELLRLLQWNDKFWLANFTLGIIYAQSGMREQAVAAFEKGVRVAAFPPMIGGLASLYAQTGNRAEAERILQGLDVPAQASGRAKGLMFFHLGCSAYDEAADYLKKLIDARDPDVIRLGCHPFLGDFQKHPRLGALISKMNLP
jgi:tetratricopeptide (TPR) repeat protein